MCKRMLDTEISICLIKTMCHFFCHIPREAPKLMWSSIVNLICYFNYFFIQLSFDSALVDEDFPFNDVQKLSTGKIPEISQCSMAEPPAFLTMDYLTTSLLSCWGIVFVPELWERVVSWVQIHAIAVAPLNSSV